MLGATEFMETTTSLTVVLWIEVIVYLGIGIYELVDDFWRQPRPWAYVNGRLNNWIHMQDYIGHKMHAALCFVLGFVALNGVLEGHVSRFEIELIFLSFALITGIIWGMLPPGRLARIMPLSKPEVFLQIAMYVFCAHLIRPQIIVLCVTLNAWGVFLYFTRQRRMLQPFTYEALREHIREAEGEATLARIDKVAGYVGEAESEAGAEDTRGE